MGQADHELHGLVLRSPVPLPLPLVSGREPDLVYRIEPTAHGLPAPTVSRADHPDDPWVIQHWDDAGRQALEFPDWATFEITETEIVLRADDTGDDKLLAHLLIDHVLPRVIALRGDLVLHASANVGPSGRAHVFVGDTGTGKSTLAAWLSANGWPLLDDDVVRVVTRGGRPSALPGYAGVRLLPDAATVVFGPTASGQEMARGHAKHRFAVEGLARMAGGPAPIGAVYILERDAAVDEATLEPIGFTAVLTRVAASGFHYAERPTDITRQAFERGSELAATATGWRLRYPVGLHRLSATRRLLERSDAMAGVPTPRDSHAVQAGGREGPRRGGPTLGG